VEPTRGVEPVRHHADLRRCKDELVRTWKHGGWNPFKGLQEL
jgi:hypothetical protein